MKKPAKPNVPIHLTINKFKESISQKKYNNNINIKLNQNKKEENKSSSRSGSKITSSRILSGRNSHRNDKVEKKLYLEDINKRNHINVDLSSKLSSTFKSFNFQSIGNDSKIEANLFNIGVKRSNLLRKSMATVRNMIQDFDNQFSINFDINNLNQKQKDDKKNLNNKYDTKQIKEESYSDFDFNLNKTNEENNNQNLIKTKNFFKEMKKGKKYLKQEKSIEEKIKNEKKIIGLKNAFKYYELLYNYKYFLTEKDILGLSFNRRKKMEKRELDKYLKTPRIKYDVFEEKYYKCDKCEKNRKSDKYKYKNNLNIHLFNRNFSDININQINNNMNNNRLFQTELNNNDKKDNNFSGSKKILKRALSGYSNSNNNIAKKAYLYSNSNSKYTNTKSRPTTASSNKFQKFNKKVAFNTLDSPKKLELDLSDISSNNQSPIPKNKEKKIVKSQNFLTIKNRVENLSQVILSTADKLKSGLKDTYKNIIKKIEEEKKPVKKVKKKVILDLDQIREELNLKSRGEGINEIKMIMDNVDKLYKSLPKTHVDLMRSIAKIVIYEERRKNKPLIYNDTYDNKLFRNRFKKEMFQASYKMKKIRKSLNKNKAEKPFDEKLKHLLKNDVFIFFNIKSLKEEIDKIKVLKGEIIKD